MNWGGWFLGLWLVLMSGCHSALPDFGIPVPDTELAPHPEQRWCTSLPDQFIVKHLVSLGIQHPTPQNLEFLGYLSIKAGDLRLLGMSELGTTLLDVCAVENHPPRLLQAPATWNQPQLLAELVQDIRLLFLSSRSLAHEKITEYRKQPDAHRLVVYRPQGHWIAWETRNKRCYQITRGQNTQTLCQMEFDPAAPTSFGLSHRITVTYPAWGIQIQIQILTINPKELPDARFRPPQHES